MKYKFIALAAALGFLTTPISSAYAQEDPAPATMTDSDPEAVTAPENADLAPLSASAEKSDPLGTAGEVVKDVRAGDWRHAIAGLLVIVMFGLAKARDNTTWFKGDRAGALLVIGLGLGGGLVTTLYADGPLDWQLFLGSASVITSAVGIYTLAKKVFFPSDAKAKPTITVT